MIEDILEMKTKHCEISIHFDLYYNETVELERPENVLDIVQEVVARTDFEECYRQGQFRLLNDVHFILVTLPDSDTEIDLGYEDDMQEIFRRWGRMRKEFNQTRKHLDDNILLRRTRHCQVSLRHGAVYTETVINLA